MDRRTRRVSIELHGEGSPPVGVAYGEGGARRAFDGWLGLIFALGELLGGDGPRGDRNEMEDEDVDHTTHRA
jgi:hypothetical protein